MDFGSLGDKIKSQKNKLVSSATGKKSDSDFFSKMGINGAVGVEQSMLGPDYKYYKHILPPSALHISGEGTMGAMGRDIAGIENYVKVLVEGGGPATGGKILGSRFYVKTAGKCKDVYEKDKKKQIKTRSIYIDNVPDGNIPLLTSGLGMNLSEFRGLLPGIVEDAGALNPMSLFAAFGQGTTPDCKLVSFPVVGDNRKGANKVPLGISNGYVAITEINEYIAGQKMAMGSSPTAKQQATLKKLMSEGGLTELQQKQYTHYKQQLAEQKLAKKHKLTEGFLSGNRILRGEEENSSLQIETEMPPLANLYFTGFGFLLMYLMYKMIHKK